MTDPAHKRANAPHRLGVTLVAIAIVAAGSTILPTGAAEHTVAPGEALSIIADEHAVSIETLVELNDLENPDLIYVGQVLDLPSAAAEAQTRAAPTHTVASGDSLWAIATSYGMTLDTLAALNSVENLALIFPGQILNLETATTSPSSDTDDETIADTNDAGLPGPETEDDADRAAMVHEVVAGDTLSGIASRYSLALDVLLSTNDLDLTSVIFPGQRIVIATSVADIDPAVLANLPTAWRCSRSSIDGPTTTASPPTSRSRLHGSSPVGTTTWSPAQAPSASDRCCRSRRTSSATC